jgi:hypothetical protein
MKKTTSGSSSNKDCISLPERLTSIESTGGLLGGAWLRS